MAEDVEQTTKVIKASIQHIGWHEDYKEPLEKLVRTVHYITTHTYLFSRYVFIREKEENDTFDLRPFITARFFQEVFASLTTRQTRNSAKTNASVLSYQTLIARHLPRYMQISGYTLQNLPRSSQIAIYESTKVVTAYMNNVQERYGARLRFVINGLLEIKTFPYRPLATHFKSFYSLPPTDREYGLDYFLQNTAIIRQWCLAQRRPPTVELDYGTIRDKFMFVREVLQPVFSHYSPDRSYRQNNLYYDIKANTIEHVSAFWRLSVVSQVLGLKSFQVFPTRTSWIPCYMQIDTRILYVHILKQSKLEKSPKMEVWARVVDMNRKIFKSRGDERFEGTIMTDGVGVSVTRQNFPSGKCTRKRKRKKKKGEEDKEDGIDAIEEEDKQNLVFIDPNRRDLLYCMGYNSTPQAKQVYRYTLNQRNKETRLKKYRRIRNRAKSEAILEMERGLSQFSYNTLDIVDFEAFLRHRATMEQPLLDHYATTMSKSHHPLHRKLKLGSKIQSDRSDRRLAQSLRRKFGDGAQLVIGDWSAGHQRFQQPTRGIGVRRMLRKEGFAVFLINEYKTSKVCNSCLQPSLQTFRDRQNPRCYQREQRPITRVHGLLKCNTETCKISKQQPRLWNRDTVSVCNFRTIVDHQFTHGVRHPSFTREENNT